MFMDWKTCFYFSSVWRIDLIQSNQIPSNLVDISEDGGGTKMECTVWEMHLTVLQM